MADDDDANVFRPDGFTIEAAPNKPGIHLVLDRNSGERLTVALEMSQAVSVLLALQKQIASDSGLPINPASFRAGARTLTTGFGFGLRPDHFALTVHVELLDEDRGVSVPLRFSKKDVEDCVAMMTKWLQKLGAPPT